MIENVIDLRLPATQEWFFETFRTGYGDFWHKPNGASVSSFAPMLGNLMFPDLGGTSVTDAIGYCLRSMGIAAFIYPSARSDAEIVRIITDGRGAVMPMFRGAMALDEMWGIARYLRSFVPGTQMSKPELRNPPGQAAPATPAGSSGRSVAAPKAASSHTTAPGRSTGPNSSLPTALPSSTSPFAR